MVRAARAWLPLISPVLRLALLIHGTHVLVTNMEELCRCVTRNALVRNAGAGFRCVVLVLYIWGRVDSHRRLYWRSRVALYSVT